MLPIAPEPPRWKPTFELAPQASIGRGPSGTLGGRIGAFLSRGEWGLGLEGMVESTPGSVDVGHERASALFAGGNALGCHRAVSWLFGCAGGIARRRVGIGGGARLRTRQTLASWAGVRVGVPLCTSGHLCFEPAVDLLANVVRTRFHAGRRRRMDGASPCRDPRARRDGRPVTATATTSLRAIFESEFDYVCRAHRRLGVPERDLEDAAQETFLAVNAKLDTYDPRVRCGRGSSASSCASRRTIVGSGRRSRSTLADRQALPSSDSPEHHAATQEAKTLAMRALERMDSRSPRDLVMHDLEGFGAPEIASLLTLEVNTVYSRLRVAR